MPAAFRAYFSPPANAASPIIRAAAAGLRASSRIKQEARDLFVPEYSRLDDRLRAALNDRLRAIVGAIERELRARAALHLTASGPNVPTEALLGRADTTIELLLRTLLPLDSALAAELIGGARLSLLADGLPARPASDVERPGLVLRLVACPEPEVAAAASALLAVSDDAGASFLSDANYERLCWWVAAALGRELAEDPRADHVLAEIAAALIAVQLPVRTVETASMQLAQAIAARADELPDLLVDALGDRRPALFTALLATGSALPFAETCAIVTDADGARLWLLLRAQGIMRQVIARIGVALATADPRRDLERLADEIDEVMAVSPEDAAACFASLAWSVEYRRALDMVNA